MAGIPADKAHPSSFRDPSGFLFEDNGVLLRAVARSYSPDFNLLISSGLYDKLTRDKWLIPHKAARWDGPLPEGISALIEPEKLPFISYPYEWCFSQLKEAALLTLKIQRAALESGMTLKDASAYNIQFHNGKPVLIDTLSFEKYTDGSPWTPYRQFCQHFLAPLALAAFTDIRLPQLLKVYIDGIPLDLASKLLPWQTRFSPLLTHIHLHAAAQENLSRKPAKPSAGARISKLALQALIDDLERAVSSLPWKPAKGVWSDYYETNSYDARAIEHKKQLVAEFLDAVSPKPERVLDAGANTGLFSRIAAGKGLFTLSVEMDPLCVEKNYRACADGAAGKAAAGLVLPLVGDLVNPSPSIGWANRERDSFAQRAQSDAMLALALVHHLAIANNVPLPKIAEFFASLSRWLIIEFVPKGDPQTQRLLASRKDIFTDYNEAGFTRAFGRFFSVQRTEKIAGTDRALYLMKTL
jgi:ribosomal protein L11 methylase PrmA